MKTEHMIDWGKTAAEIEADYALVCQQRDELLAALERIERGCDSGFAVDIAKQAIASVKGDL